MHSQRPLENHPKPHTPPAAHEAHAHPKPHAAPAVPPAVPVAKSSESSGVFSTLLPALQRAVAEEGYTLPTSIQEGAIPYVLQGRDLLGCAQTGTGKTAAFVLPLLQYITQNPQPRTPYRPRALILAPTRELAAQIGDSLSAYGRHVPFSQTVIFGGVGQHPQVQALRKGVEIVVATPGRLLDLMNQGHVRLEAIEVFVLDEADRMLDMGFLPDIRRIIARLPAKRQSLFFSATLEPAVIGLANTLVRNPVHITITPQQPTVERIVQKVMFVDQGSKPQLLVQLLSNSKINRVLIFTRMKYGANRVAERLEHAGITSAAIHGNKSQSARSKALTDFKDGRVRVMVATDIAARGIDVDGITHVINYDLPLEAETYVHRIGRTARAGAEGDAISFCSAGERAMLSSIERLIRKPIPVDTNHAYHSEAASRAVGAEARSASVRGSQRRSDSRSSSRPQHSHSRPRR
jgi:ATP-dependent RNA helicase RhlE